LEASVEAQPCVPYASDEDAPEPLQRMLQGYAKRMGFLPNALKLYLHTPHILSQAIGMNNAVMRHKDNVIAEDFKYRMSFIISRGHGCRYCCAHHAMTLKKRWGLDDQRLEEILNLESPEDEREALAWEYGYLASRGSIDHDEGDEIRDRLAELFSPVEVMELAATVGFWAFYNRIHSSLAIPIEDHLLDEAHWVEVGRD
jgi:AhpD family alkylhydroperoxidase